MVDFEKIYKKELEQINSKNERAYLPYKPFGFAPKNDIDIPLCYAIFNGWVKLRIYKNFFEQNIPLNEIVGIPDKIRTGNLIQTGIIDEYEKQFKKDFDFHFFTHSVNISGKHNDKLKVNTVNINCRLNDFLSSENRPVVTHRYPKTSFTDKNYKGSIKLFISGGAGFNRTMTKKKTKSKDKAERKYSSGCEAEIKSNADFEYNYKPKVANISSYANGNELDFTFNRVNSKEEMPYPTGSLEIFGIIMRPRSIKKVALKTSVTINNHPIPYEGITRLVLSESNSNGSS